MFDTVHCHRDHAQLFCPLFHLFSCGRSIHNKYIHLSALLLCFCFVFMASNRIKGVDAGKVNKATQYSLSMDNLLKNIFDTENSVLIDWPEWGQGSPAATEKSEGSEVNCILN